MEEASSVPEDEIFVINVSESMELRNRLRSGLVDAQNKDSGKIPMLVSWPKWLDDGIVCMYARDFRGVLNDAIRQTAAVLGTVSSGDENEVAAEANNGEFKALNISSLDNIPLTGKKIPNGGIPGSKDGK